MKYATRQSDPSCRLGNATKKACICRLFLWDWLSRERYGAVTKVPVPVSTSTV
ncbi:hypothetical protein AOG1_31600 [Geobacter sp. AOG1]|nr:hypothetical protein AOG1_31600 [Geobacter sp. AOG1]